MLWRYTFQLRFSFKNPQGLSCDVASNLEHWRSILGRHRSHKSRHFANFATPRKWHAEPGDLSSEGLDHLWSLCMWPLVLLKKSYPISTPQHIQIGCDVCLGKCLETREAHGEAWKAEMITNMRTMRIQNMFLLPFLWKWPHPNGPKDNSIDICLFSFLRKPLNFKRLAGLAGLAARQSFWGRKKLSKAADNFPKCRIETLSVWYFQLNHKGESGGQRSHGCAELGPVATSYHFAKKMHS